ncbi:PEP-CTERM sorting domain-containing protein [Persicirhabdus sediminis]|uniref:PEP-CTERM sorting domain-containing protein n=1 Tax=Persicirhabdus sediminis TaxID=454144 RepID=A0A8J7MCC9_9BACT|nr:PEP-CTERM sorting domain-containing protein [Persicirhabdus sediminis]MBK1790542.1 PEP-CTERM sorting domain-containing protein [Persicirhabdus sediminis]
MKSIPIITASIIVSLAESQATTLLIDNFSSNGDNPSAEVEISTPNGAKVISDSSMTNIGSTAIGDRSISISSDTSYTADDQASMSCNTASGGSLTQQTNDIAGIAPTFKTVWNVSDDDGDMLSNMGISQASDITFNLLLGSHTSTTGSLDMSFNIKDSAGNQAWFIGYIPDTSTNPSSSFQVFYINEHVGFDGNDVVEISMFSSVEGASNNTIEITQITAVPEPSSIALIALGSGMALIRRNKKSTQ